MRDRFIGRTVLRRLPGLLAGGCRASSPAAAGPPRRRLPGLLAGLVLFGVGIAVMAASGLGLGPWEAFHQGIANRTGLALGTVSILVGIPVLAPTRSG
jgi:hypothetical protein